MEFGNVSELILDDVNVGNSNLRILANDGQNISKLLLASRLPTIQHKYGNGNNCRRNSRARSIKIVSNNFGLIDKYRVNLVNSLSINETTETSENGIVLWNTSNTINLEMVTNKFGDIVLEPIIYLFYKTMSLGMNEQNIACFPYGLHLRSRKSLQSKQLIKSLIPKIIPKAIIFDFVLDETDKQLHLKPTAANFVCNCTLYTFLILKSISTSENCSFVTRSNDSLMRHLNESIDFHMPTNLGLYKSKCESKCDDVIKLTKVSLQQSLSNYSKEFSEDTKSKNGSETTQIEKMNPSVEKIANLSQNFTPKNRPKDHGRSLMPNDKKGSDNNSKIRKFEIESNHRKFKYDIINNHSLDNALSKDIEKDVPPMVLNLIDNTNSSRNSSSQHFWTNFGHVFSSLANHSYSNASINGLLSDIIHEKNNETRQVNIAQDLGKLEDGRKVSTSKPIATSLSYQYSKPSTNLRPEIIMKTSSSKPPKSDGNGKSSGSAKKKMSNTKASKSLAKLSCTSNQAHIFLLVFIVGSYLHLS